MNFSGSPEIGALVALMTHKEDRILNFPARRCASGGLLPTASAMADPGSSSDDDDRQNALMRELGLMGDSSSEDGDDAAAE